MLKLSIILYINEFSKITTILKQSIDVIEAFFHSNNLSQQLGSMLGQTVHEVWLATARPRCEAKDDIFSVAASGSLADSTG